MRRLLQMFTLGLILAAGAPLLAKEGAPGPKHAVCEKLARALESGDRALLTPLFPSERKVRVALHRIADMEGFSGAGPLVEAFTRYLTARTDVHFERDSSDPEEKADPLRVRGILSSRAAGKPRERVALVFIFETIGDRKMIVEVRETG